VGDARHARLFKAAADTQRAIDSKLAAGDFDTIELETKLAAEIDQINPQIMVKPTNSNISLSHVSSYT